MQKNNKSNSKFNVRKLVFSALLVAVHAVLAITITTPQPLLINTENGNLFRRLPVRRKVLKPEHVFIAMIMRGDLLRPSLIFIKKRTLYLQLVPQWDILFLNVIVENRISEIMLKKLRINLISIGIIMPME